MGEVLVFLVPIFGLVKNLSLGSKKTKPLMRFFVDSPTPTRYALSGDRKDGRIRQPYVIGWTRATILGKL
jgi:hypothetical protein